MAVKNEFAGENIFKKMAAVFGMGTFYRRLRLLRVGNGRSVKISLCYGSRIR
jgi:hypothetical protein